MINTATYVKLRKNLLKNFKNQRVYIELRGIVTTRIFFEPTRVIVNRNKLILATEEQDFTLEFLELKKIKFDDIYHLELQYEQFTVILEL